MAVESSTAFFCKIYPKSGTNSPMSETDHVIIIGNGITGITCALEIRKRSECKITVISEEADFFFSRPALMYVFMGHMTRKQIEPYEGWFWEKNAIQLEKRKVIRIHPEHKFVRCSDSGIFSYTKLILATGSQFNKFGWPGQDLPGVQGFYSLQDLQQLETNSANVRQAVIVGGGLIGVEVAEMLLSRGIGVDFLVREKYFWDIVLPQEEAELIGRHIRAHGVNLRLETEMKSIGANHLGRADRVTLTSGEEIPCRLVALTAGVSPNKSLAQASGIACDRGILVNKRFETSHQNIYAAGDCAQFHEAIPGRRSVEQVWYTGKAQAETLAQILTGIDMEYAPGVWFNSAKFFDLEYQVYGNVPAKLPESDETFLWRNAAGDKCLRLNWNKHTQALTGIHAIGLRLRQNICCGWITDKRQVHSVINELARANFDPEFFKKHEREIAASFAASAKVGTAHG